MTVTWETNVTEVVWESQTAPGITWTTVVGGTGGTTVPDRRLLPNTVGDPGQVPVVNEAGTGVEYADGATATPGLFTAIDFRVMPDGPVTWTNGDGGSDPAELVDISGLLGGQTPEVRDGALRVRPEDAATSADCAIWLQFNGPTSATFPLHAYVHTAGGYETYINLRHAVIPASPPNGGDAATAGMIYLDENGSGYLWLIEVRASTGVAAAPCLSKIYKVIEGAIDDLLYETDPVAVGVAGLWKLQITDTNEFSIWHMNGPVGSFTETSYPLDTLEFVAVHSGQVAEGGPVEGFYLEISWVATAALGTNLQTLGATPGSSGNGGAVDSVNGETGVVVLTASDVGAQSADSDLTAIAALAPSDDALIQRKAGAWTSRTPAQVKADMSLGVGDISGLDENTRDVIGTALVGGTGITVTVDDPGNTITPRLANVADRRVLGNISGASAAPAELTALQAQSLLGDLQVAMPPVVGGYLHPPAMQGSSARTLSSSVTNARTYASPGPIWVPSDCTIDALLIYQSVAATDSGATGELALSTPGPWPFAGTLLTTPVAFDATATAGLRTVTLATPLAVKRGLYWAWLKFKSSTTAGTTPQFVTCGTLYNYAVNSAATPAPSYTAVHHIGAGLGGTASMPDPNTIGTLQWGFQPTGTYLWIAARVSAV